MPVRPTLAIVVPTYNRAQELRGLLETLVAELPEEAKTTILVADNCSTDETQAVLAAYRDRLGLQVHRHETNIGAAANLAWLFANAPDADYLWCLCDDDRPVKGALPALIEFLRGHAPVWLHLPHYWINQNGDPASGSNAPSEILEFEGSGELFRSQHHWLTFASASIVDRDLASNAAIEHPTDNAYPHLVWWTLACLEGKCMVAPAHLVYGSAAISWADQRTDILCRHFPGLYEAGLEKAVSRSEFAAALDILYEPAPVAELWQQLPLDDLIGTVERFPDSRRLRGVAWDIARHRADSTAIKRLQACQPEQTLAAARQALGLGEQAFLAGQFAEAEQQFGLALVESPTLPEAWNNLGVVFYETGRLAGAAEAFRNAIMLDPEYEDAVHNLASVEG